MFKGNLWQGTQMWTWERVHAIDQRSLPMDAKCYNQDKKHCHGSVHNTGSPFVLTLEPYVKKNLVGKLAISTFNPNLIYPCIPLPWAGSQDRKLLLIIPQGYVHGSLKPEEVGCYTSYRPAVLYKTQIMDNWYTHYLWAKLPLSLSHTHILTHNLPGMYVYICF